MPAEEDRVSSQTIIDFLKPNLKSEVTAIMLCHCNENGSFSYSDAILDADPVGECVAAVVSTEPEAKRKQESS